MTYDYDILFEFIPTKDKSQLLVWDNAFQSMEGLNIIAVYRAPFEERIVIPISLYNQRLKQKQRQEKLNKILC